MLTAYAYYWLEVGDLTRAVLFQRQSLEAAQRGGDHQVLLTITANLGLLYATLGLYAEARTTLERCREQAALVGDVWLLAGAMRLLGPVSWYNEEPAQARALFEQALEQLTVIGDADGTATCHAYLGYIFDAAGDYALAAEHLAQARAGFAGIGVMAALLPRKCSD